MSKEVKQYAIKILTEKRQNLMIERETLDLRKDEDFSRLKEIDKEFEMTRLAIIELQM